MKTSPHFKIEIQDYLEQLAVADPLFAPMLKKPNKNIDDCLTYILNTVKKTGCAGFSDAEIFGMAVHYYDENNIDIGNPIKCKIVVNHTVELTEEEKEQAHKEALERVRNEEYSKLKGLGKKTTINSTSATTVQQGSLF